MLLVKGNTTIFFNTANNYLEFSTVILVGDFNALQAKNPPSGNKID